jgi:hypothetical protein
VCVALIKHRPKIRLHAPRTVLPGQPFQVRVILVCKRAVPVEFVDVELRWATMLRPFGQHEGGEREVEPMCMRARVHEGGELAEGEHEQRVVFRVPPDAPPSYDGASLAVHYRLRVHVSVPWWPDLRAEFVVQVLSAPVVGGEPTTPAVFVSDADARGGRAPFFELSLGSTTVTPGGRLEGALALVGTKINSYRRAALSLVAVETMHGVLDRIHHNQLGQWTLALSELGDGEPLRFSLQLPPGVAAGFKIASASLRWYLHARVEVARARDPEVWIPLTIVGRRDADSSEEQAPPAVGSERLDRLWRAVAAQCDMYYESGAIHGAVGAARLRIALESADRGAHVVARIETPDLGLGLGLRGTPPRFTGRDAAQVAWLEGQLAECLARRRPVAAHDGGLVFQLDGGGRSTATLGPFVAEVKAIGARLEALRDRIPAPVAMAAALPAWERAAGQLGGRLQRASMTLVGRVDDVALTVRTAWDERGLPRHTVLELRPELPVDARHHVTWVEGDEPPAVDLPLGRLWAGARAFEITADAVRMIVDAPLADPLDEMDRLVTLAALGHHLAGRRGHYR